MTTATLDELRNFGFQELTGSKKKSYRISWLEKDGILAIARCVKRGLYKITRAKDKNDHFYDAAEIEREFHDLPSLLTSLQNPRFMGMEQQKEKLKEIASTPKTESIDMRRKNLLEQAKNYEDKTRRRLECELIAAEFAHDHGRPYT